VEQNSVNREDVVSEAMQMWAEVTFNVLYLIAVWGLVVAMARRLPHLPAHGRRLAGFFVAAFALLALGDTGHVGFRVLAYASGSLGASVTLLGSEIGLVGIGVISTSFTVTLFYFLFFMAWRERFDRRFDWLGAVMLGAVVIRLALMLFPQNEWNSVTSPQPWATYRNLPLLVLGLGVAGFMLRDSVRADDRTFKWIAAMILVSFAFYIPVVLLVEIVPVIGMLMIPKTMAYVIIAWIAYRDLFRPASLREAPARSAG
jgi:hypothetical protein